MSVIEMQRKIRICAKLLSLREIEMGKIGTLIQIILVIINIVDIL